MFIGGSGYGNNWVGKPNNNLWGNSLGYEFPHKSALQQSISIRVRPDTASHLRIYVWHSPLMADIV